MSSTKHWSSHHHSLAQKIAWEQRQLNKNLRKLHPKHHYTIRQKIAWEEKKLKENEDKLHHPHESLKKRIHQELRQLKKN